MICGVVLAAGEGRRFAAASGGAPKQLATLDGRPLVEHALAAMAAAPVDGRLVVLGAHADAILAAADLHGHRVVSCADWAQGMAASLRAGVAAARAAGADAVVVTLADEPRIGADAIARVVAAQRDGDDAVRATYAGQPGHPVLLTRSLFAAVASLRGDHGAREILRSASVRAVACDDIGSPGDVDVPSDLGKMIA